MENTYSQKEQRSWAMYDWANSVYPLVITTAIFPIFYEAVSTTKVEGVVVSDMVNFFGFELKNTVLISYVSAFIFVLVSLMSPFLSGIADYAHNKKAFLKGFYLLGGLACIGLYFFEMESLELSMLIYVLAGVGFWASLVFYNGFLPEIAPAKDHDKLSAKGYALGYLGSSLLLIVCLAAIMVLDVNPKYAFIATGIWWIGFATNSIAKIQERKTGERKKLDVYKGFKEIGFVLKQLKNQLALKRYLQAFFVFSMGVQTVMLMAVYFGTKEVAWPNDEAKTTGLIVSVLIIQFIAIGGSYLIAKLSAMYGNKKALAMVLLAWCVLCVSALWVTTPIHFYIIAAFVGLVMGGVQSLSRSTYSKLLPETKDTASYFSFYDIAEKVGIVIGTFAYGSIEQLTGSMRNSIFALIVFFIIGLLLLLRVPKTQALQKSV